jgi:quercetin dioxygenase-like cupin family protein
MAFARNARIEPHSSPNATWFVVIEGGGWVGVGDERTRIAAGESACWPADVIHSAWTEHSEMRALVVELSGADDGGAVLLGRGDPRRPVALGIGELDQRSRERPNDSGSGEPT